MLKKVLKTLEKFLSCSKKKVRIYGNENEIRAHRTTTDATARMKIERMKI